jgi:hypothetical protein
MPDTLDVLVFCYLVATVVALPMNAADGLGPFSSRKYIGMDNKELFKLLLI